MAIVELKRSIKDIKAMVNKSYSKVIDKDERMKIFKSDWISMGIKFKNLGERVRVKTKKGDRPLSYRQENDVGEKMEEVGY